MAGYMLTKSAVTLVDDEGRPHTFNLSEQDENTVNEAILQIHQGDFDKALEMLSPRQQIETFFDQVGNVVIQDGAILYRGEPLHSYAVQRALEFARQGLPYRPLLQFIDRVQQNPSFRAVQELYQFLEYSGMPLTMDGKFMAYKKVRRRDDGHLASIADSSFINDPGTVVEVPRNQVDEDPGRTCSYGLHVCSFRYLPYFGGGPWDTVVSVEVDPADVVAVPYDYGNSKMRVSRYRVVSELPDYKEDYLAEHDLFLDEDNDEADEDWIENDWSGYRGCPPNGVDPDDEVEVQFRSNEESSTRGKARDFDWSNDNHGLDVLYYRVLSSHPSPSHTVPAKPEGSEWRANMGYEPLVKQVDVIRRNGTKHQDRSVDTFDWAVANLPRDIIWWRPTQYR